MENIEKNQKENPETEEYSNEQVQAILKEYHLIKNRTKAYNVYIYYALEKLQRYHDNKAEEAEKRNSGLASIKSELIDRETARHEIRKFQDKLYKDIELPLTTRDALSLMRITIPSDLSNICNGSYICRAIRSFCKSKLGKWMVGIISAIIGAVIAAILIKKYLGL